VARLGERYTMVIAGIVSMLAVVGMALAPVLAVFTIGVFLLGFCAAAFGLARHAFMTTRAPIDIRARALSRLGGSTRPGTVRGPFITPGLLGLGGTETTAIWFYLVCLVALVVLVLFGPDPEKTTAAADAESALLVEDTGEPVTGSIPTAARTGV